MPHGENYSQGKRPWQGLSGKLLPESRGRTEKIFWEKLTIRKKSIAYFSKKVSLQFCGGSLCVCHRMCAVRWHTSPTARLPARASRLFPGAPVPGIFLYGTKKRGLFPYCAGNRRRKKASEKRYPPVRKKRAASWKKKRAGRPQSVLSTEPCGGTAQGSDAPFRGSAYSGDDSALAVRSSPVKGQGAGALAAGCHGNHPRISPEENVTAQPRPADSWKERGSPSPEKSAICGLRGVSRPAGPGNCRTCCVRSLPSPGTASRVWRRRADRYR